MRLLSVAVLSLALAGCASGGSETVLVTETETETKTETETEMVIETFVEPLGLPTDVAETHFALLEAAESGDYEALRPLLPASGFSYTFGGAVQGGPIAYWQLLERQVDERPIEILARILRLPYTLSGGRYVWPFAYDKQEDELTAHERELLGDLANSYSGAGSGYLGWRAGIEPDGTWRFFIAGD